MLTDTIERPSLAHLFVFLRVLLWQFTVRPPFSSFQFEYFPMRFWFRVSKVIAFRNREERDIPLCFSTQHVV